MGYLPVRDAALFGVQTESGVTSCRKRAPSSASRSMFGVFIVLLPKQPRSAIPRSSTRNIRIFGFADVRLVTKNREITLNQECHIANAGSYSRWPGYRTITRGHWVPISLLVVTSSRNPSVLW